MYLDIQYNTDVTTPSYYVQTHSVHVINTCVYPFGEQWFVVCIITAMDRFEGALDVQDFVDIAVHRSQTPQSFYSEKPILYHQSLSASLSISVADLNSAPLLASFANSYTLNGSRAGDDSADSIPVEHQPDSIISNVDIWVTSEHLKLYIPSHHAGVTIQYPAISVIAAQHSPPSVYLQILKALGSYDDHDPESSLSVTLIPAASTNVEAPSSPPSDALPSPTQLLYTALTECSNLHPDQDESNSENDGPDMMYEGGDQSLSSGIALPPPIPGGGGWITADNVNDFFDEDGNFRPRAHANGEALGPGAGAVRAREENEEGDVGARLNGDATKWQRTD